VESGALSVDGLRVPLRGFRKSHQLISAGSGQPNLDCNSQHASCQRILARGVRNNHRI
jgi:hypothetical protein